MSLDDSLCANRACVLYRSIVLANNYFVDPIPSRILNIQASVTGNCFTESTYGPENPACDLDAPERNALAQLFTATDGSHWSGAVNWDPTSSSSDPCFDAWVGVECEFGHPSHVT